MDEQKTVDINDFKKEQAKRKLNDWLDKYIIRPAKALVNWAVENPALAIGAATAMIPLANKVIRFKQYQAEDRRRATDRVISSAIQQYGRRKETRLQFVTSICVNCV